MVNIGNYELSDADFTYLCDALAKLIPHYQVDRDSLRDLNFLRRLKNLHHKLKRKRPAKSNGAAMAKVATVATPSTVDPIAAYGNGDQG